jgi:hypothetical protein
MKRGYITPLTPPKAIYDLVSIAGRRVVSRYGWEELIASLADIPPGTYSIERGDGIQVGSTVVAPGGRWRIYGKAGL